MMDRLAIRRVAQLRGLSWSAPLYPTISRTAFPPARSHSTAQNVTDVSFWKSLVPRPLRRENRIPAQKSSKQPWLTRDWNPATFYIVIFLMIGSMSIQMISLRKNFETYMRRSDVRVGLLREVVEKLQNGEQVDVEKVLGSGDAEREAEWEEMVNEIEKDNVKDNVTKNQKKQEKPKAADTAAPVAELVAVPESKAGHGPTNELPKGRMANFF